MKTAHCVIWQVMSELTRYGSGDYVLRQKTWFFTSPVHSAHDVFEVSLPCKFFIFILIFHLYHEVATIRSV